MAVLITLVASLVTTTRMDIEDAENLRNDQQNELMVDAAVRLVKHQLLQDMQSSKFDSHREHWASPVENLKINDSKISWTITDEGGKLNVNLLALGSERKKEDMREVLIRLVKRTAEENNVDLSQKTGSPIVILRKDSYRLAVDGIIRFMDGKVQEAIANGAVKIDDEKITVERPILFGVDELIQAEGITAKLLYGHEGHKGLADLLTVWSDDLININTAPEGVLRALSETMDDGAVEAVERYRQGNSFATLDDIANVEGLDPGLLDELKDIASVTSRYFVAHITVQTGRLQKKRMVVLRRPDIAKVIAQEAPPTVGVIYSRQEL